MIATHPFDLHMAMSTLSMYGDSSSLASRLRQIASDMEDDHLSDSAQSTSSRLAFDTSYASQLANVATRYASQLHDDRTVPIQSLASSFRFGEAWSALSQEHRELLSVGAADQVLTELVSERRFNYVDLIHAALESVVPVGSDLPPSYQVHELDASPPSYSSSFLPRRFGLDPGGDRSTMTPASQ